MGPRTLSSNITGHILLLFLTSSTHLLSSKFKSNQGVCKWTVVDHLNLCFFLRVDSSSKTKSFQIWNLFFFHTRKSVHFYSLPENADQIQIGPSAVRLSLQMASAIRDWCIPPQRIHSTCHSSNKVEVSPSVYLSNLSVHPLLKYVSITYKAMPSIVLGI